MKIVIIGYGKMGHEIEKVARERGHSVVLTIDENNTGDLAPENLNQADTAIEFSTPETAADNILFCLEAGIPVVAGTTGWTHKMEEIKRSCIHHDGTFFYASNYSIGVNIFFYLNRKLAALMERYAQYDVHIREAHHIHKKDSPSGTAITLAEDIIGKLSRKSSWINGHPLERAQLPIFSIREGEIPGIHRVIYESEEDTLELFHSAKSRRGFALGAVMAAEFIQGKKGCFGMNDLLGLED
ncbi:MAG: 4-hydroxy-tetrahydrodipicolinate reductase [Chlorobi bacterium]|nr:4-hydroxy-tetrahydrodipicolinate reductase [Chlorobiota bacterium]